MDAPTRTDPVAAAASEWAGGPLGARAAGHPWWSPVRVLLVLTGVVLAAGMLGKAACVPTAWDGETRPYAELCWTELAGVSAASAEQPWHATSAERLADRVAEALPGDPTVAAAAVLAIALAALVLLATVLLAGVAPGRPWAAAGWAVAPVLAVQWLSWDVVAAVGVALLAFAWARRSVAAALLGAVLLVAFGFPLLDTRTADTGSWWLVLEQVTDDQVATTVRTGVVALVLVLALVGAAVLVRRRRATDPLAPLRAALLVLVAALVVAPSAPPEAALLLLPLAALVVRRWRDLLVWQSCEVLSWALTGWYLGGVLAPTSGGDVRAYWLAVVLRTVGLIHLLAAAVGESGDDDLVEGGGGEPHADVDLVADVRDARA